jgi:Spy/CpxP family protein refolding chaperone
MKPWLKRTFVGLFGATALLGGVTACSHASHHRSGWQAMSEEDVAKTKTRIVDKVGEKLELNADQKAKLGVLFDRLHEQRTALHRGGQLRGEITALIKDNTFDRWHAQDLVNAELNAVRDKSPAVIAALGDFYDSLTPAQQQKLRDHLQRMGEHRWGRRG